MKQFKLILLTITIGLMVGSLVNAQSFPDTWKSHDLSKYKMPFSIMAPASATLEYDSDSEELWIEAEADHFRVMIVSYDEKVADLVAEYKEEVGEEGVTLVFDEPNGFLAQFDYDGDLDFELYYAFAVKGKTYLVQSNPLGEGYYTEEAASNMFQACKKAAGL